MFQILCLLALAPGLGFAAMRGQVYELKPSLENPLFQYEMSQSREGDVEQWTARYTDTNKKPFTVENTFLEKGSLVRYELEQSQLREQAEIKVTPAGVSFKYLKDGKWKEDWEKTTGEVIARPQVIDYVLRHWDALKEGKTKTVRFIVPDRLETLGFRFQYESSLSSATADIFHFEPTSFFVRQAVNPIAIAFDPATKKPLWIRGRTFLKKKQKSQWEDLTAETRFE